MPTEKKERKGGFPLWLLILILVGVPLLCCGGTGIGLLGIYWFKGGGPGDKSFQSYVKRRPTGPATFRLKARQSVYYNYAYQLAAATHYSIDLADPESPASVTGYIPKSSADGQRLNELLKDRAQHLITVELLSVGPDGARIGPVQGNVLSITRLID